MATRTENTAARRGCCMRSTVSAGRGPVNRGSDALLRAAGRAADLLDHGEDLAVGEDVIGGLGPRQDGVDELLRRLDLALPEPVVDVRRARHVPDADLLLAPEHAGGHARVDAV